ncbi:MAG TPA: hypothetical protein VF681_00190 [Abditibacteriaceae bacterium]|jgi:hypothetical protein
MASQATKSGKDSPQNILSAHVIMELNVEVVEDIRELVSQGQEQEIADITWSNETLAGSLHLACFEAEIQAGLPLETPLTDCLNAWDAQLPMLNQARRAMQHRGVWPVPLSMHAQACEWEILPIPLELEVDGLIWSQFQRRFCQSLKGCNFKGKLPVALTGALHEMADNALRHSGSSIKYPARGAVGYCVQEGQMVFAVVDAGRGVLKSLRSNPTLPRFDRDDAALYAAVLQRNTSDAQKQIGDGFEQVHRALSDLNGQLRFRSGNAVLELDGRGDAREIIPRHGMSKGTGFQLVVQCALDHITPDDVLRL